MKGDTGYRRGMMDNIMTLGQRVHALGVSRFTFAIRDGAFQAIPVFERVAKGHIEGLLVVSWLGEGRLPWRVAVLVTFLFVIPLKPL